MNKITDSEQVIMRIVWTKGQATGREIITDAQAAHQWSMSTIKTLIRRLTDKEMLAVDQSTSPFTYTPLVAESDATDDFAQQFFDSVCNAYKGTLLTGLLESEPLSKSDIQKMQAVLAERLPDAPDQVPCNCLHSDIDESCAMTANHEGGHHG
ncbi:CopY/TcrY family copper transport repressor [Fructobacillus ficulneus]|uniref:Negative transcriptional regulator-copper transport operon n=1 Tax=Fructobacillus ficulneus TaxID=157463 RepID=A0A0K8MID2_9LACO|nr:CopY/TcrY family copper transport repressor [Fructobacillus ficulneus]GAP00327.1 negative transcriptional regulator-copper transport operon [Fructobacillus ficulneus]